MRIKHVAVAVFIMCDKITRWLRLLGGVSWLRGEVGGCLIGKSYL